MRRVPYPVVVLVLSVASLGGFLWYLVSHKPVVRDGSPSWSPDGKSIVFRSERAGRGDLYVMGADGSNPHPIVETEANEESPAFSPDGQTIAYDTDRDGNSEIYVVAIGGGQTRRLTSNPARDLSPAWSPDGKKIAFMSDRDSRPAFDVFLMNADGTGLERVTRGGSSWFPQFSPDGSRLTMHVTRDVAVLDLASRTSRKLTADPVNGMYPSWFPDGRTLAFMSWRNGATALFTINDNGRGEKELLRLAKGSALDPRVSPDGTHVAFVQVPDASPEAMDSKLLPHAIYVLDIASGRVTRLSQ